MEKIKIFDNLNFSKDRDILKIIDNEKIYYSGNIIKINQIGKNQERNIILTNRHVYNFKKKSMKRKIPLTSILGLSYSKLSDEFIIHGKNEQHDISYKSEDKLSIICLVVLLYQELEDIIMPICEINEKTLRKYVTFERDKKRNRNITKMDSSFQINTKEFINCYKSLVTKEEESRKKIENNNENLRMMSYGDFKDFIIMESKIKIEHFKLIKQIKRDSFGLIIISHYLKDNKLYLLKSLNKDFLLEHNLIEKILLEKNILQKMEYPFINKMEFCFQKEDIIFFGFNYFKTINLYNELCLCRFFNEEKVKFYASIIGITLEFLHKNKITYRNFNLKNMSINEEGYLLFNTFYDCKLNEESSNYSKFNGEIEYMAPEVINGEEQSDISDWWSFGIIIYEMFFGITPFLDDDNNQIYDNIINGDIKYPKKNNISAEAKDLLQKLLIKEKNDRLGFEGGFEVIKKHYFFKEIDFDKLEKKEIEPPFKPTLNDEINNQENEELSILNINNIDFYQDDIKESKIEFLKNNQGKFEEFYE